MQDEKKCLRPIPLEKPKIRMIGCRAVGLRFQGFIGHSTKGFLEDVSYRELNCDSLCHTSLEAMASARKLLLALSIRYGFNPLSGRSN
jgi:hypothetical protein